jgi:hypothetical protein
MSLACPGVPGGQGRDGTTLHPKERLPVENRKEPTMIELFCLPPAALAHPPELPPLPLWLQLGLAGAVALVIALALTLS